MLTMVKIIILENKLIFILFLRRTYTFGSNFHFLGFRCDSNYYSLMYLLSTDIKTHKQEDMSSSDGDVSLHENNETEQMVE